VLCCAGSCCVVLCCVVWWRSRSKQPHGQHTGTWRRLRRAVLRVAAPRIHPPTHAWCIRHHTAPHNHTITQSHNHTITHHTLTHSTTTFTLTPKSPAGGKAAPVKALCPGVTYDLVSVMCEMCDLVNVMRELRGREQKCGLCGIGWRQPHVLWSGSADRASRVLASHTNITRNITHRLSTMAHSGGARCSRHQQAHSAALRARQRGESRLSACDACDAASVSV
jgi:hypothetical protein